MKKLIYLFISSLVLVIWFPYACQANEDVPTDQETHVEKRNYRSPITVLDSVKWNANRKRSEQVQKTRWDKISSFCINEGFTITDERFTITKTLCSIKYYSRTYLEYVVYAWLAVATIFIIRNWFQLVTSSDRWKQMWEFRNNIKYLIIWVILLICFYYIIDVFVSLVNLVWDIN